VDGNYGSYTQSAVLRFQSRNGLLADGRVGSQTRAALFGTGRIMNPR
jgi:peptidoglycan hydrolase-like protein with peptidoglycan-binding domain